MSEDRELDVVVFGATGFVGRLVAGYLAGHAPGGVRIGLAGRSGQRLADVRTGLGAAASAWPLLVADSADPVSLAALARAARVVVSTVGPYRAQGLALVQACAEAGTHYADLTGDQHEAHHRTVDQCQKGQLRPEGRRIRELGSPAFPVHRRRAPVVAERLVGHLEHGIVIVGSVPADQHVVQLSRRRHRLGKVTAHPEEVAPGFITHLLDECSR